MSVTVVMALKELTAAKSRLAGSRPAEREALVLAMLGDTLAAVAAAGVDRVVVVSPDARVHEYATAHGATARHEPAGGGLNAALTHGAVGADGRVVYLQADLPALRPESLTAALQAARAHPVSFVADRHGTGTVLLAVATGTDFPPAFGPDSAAAHHRAGATELDPERSRWPDLRCDADTPEDLFTCTDLGLGPKTLSALASLPSGPPGLGGQHTRSVAIVDND